MGTLTHDLRYGARMLWKSRGFTLASVLVLALGIGATTAIFSVVNSVLLRPLPYPESERLLVLWGYKDSDRGHTVVTYPDLEDWRAQTQTLEYIAAFNPSGALLRGEGGGEPEPLSGAVVSADLFPMLGVRPVVGRAFTREEDRAGAPPVVIIGHDLWRRRFNSDPSIVGRQIRLGSAGVPTTVVGVLPQGFSFPPQAAKTEFLRPVAQAIGERTKMRGSYSLPVVARLKAGATVRQAEAEMRAVGERLEQLYPDEGFRLGRRFAPLDEEVAGTALRRSLLVLLGAVGFVLLIACANVANLLLTRATARHREIAIRTALGASRGRIVRQLLTESLLLSAAGGAAGLLLATWGTALLTSAAPADIPRLNEIGLDARVLVFAVAVSLLTGVVFGLAPALQALRVNLQESLKEGGRSASAGAARSRLRSSLVVAEVALSLVLLVGAGLLVRSFARLTGLNPGFDPQNVLTVTLSLPRQKYAKPEQQLAAFSEIVRRVGEVPGVESAGAIYPLPLGGTTTGNTFLIEGRPAPAPSEKESANYRIASPDYFRVMRLTLTRGRQFAEQDRAGSAPVLVVNETFARKFFPGENPLGRRIVIERTAPAAPGFAAPSEAEQPAREIVGVVGDVRHDGLDQEAGPEFYVPLAQAPEPVVSVVARTAGDLPGTGAAIREAVRAVDKDQYVPSVEPMTRLVSTSLARRRFNAVLTGLFASVALLLAAVGIFGVTAYTVAQRTHEIGLRMALGAQRGDVLRLVVGQGSRLILAGVGVGLVASFALTRVLEGLLFEVTATDPATFALVALVLTSVALLACYVPARRATKVDPMVALRYE